MFVKFVFFLSPLRKVFMPVPQNQRPLLRLAILMFNKSKKQIYLNRDKRLILHCEWIIIQYNHKTCSFLCKGTAFDYRRSLVFTAQCKCKIHSGTRRLSKVFPMTAGITNFKRRRWNKLDWSQHTKKKKVNDNCSENHRLMTGSCLRADFSPLILNHQCQNETFLLRALCVWIVFEVIDLSRCRSQRCTPVGVKRVLDLNLEIKERP